MKYNDDDTAQMEFLKRYRTDEKFRRKHNWYEVLTMAALLAYVFSLFAFVAWGFWGIWM